MNVTTVSEGIYRLATNVENILFEGIWPIPNGVSLNSYIVKGERTAIIDGFCGWDGVPETLFEQLKEIDVDPHSIDYIIINHMEPDHSGWLEAFSKIRPEFKVLCSEKAVPLLDAFFDIKLNIEVVKPGDTLDLGNGRVLAFEYIPNVHWPETMATFDTLSGTLFPCDAFGSYGSITDKPYDDQLSPQELAFYEQEAVRYYANIVAAFCAPVQQALKKCAQLPIKTIAPGHGIVFRKNPQKIIDDYTRYASWSKGPAREEICVVWGSMYGNTEKALEPVIRALTDSGIKYHLHEIPKDSIGEILASAWSSTGIILGMPTYEYKMFPPMAMLLDELGKKKVLQRKALRFGSYGWSGGAQKELDEIVSRQRMHWDFLDPVEFKGSPKESDLDLLYERTSELIRKVSQSVQKAAKH